MSSSRWGVEVIWPVGDMCNGGHDSDSAFGSSNGFTGKLFVELLQDVRCWFGGMGVCVRGAEMVCAGAGRYPGVGRHDQDCFLGLRVRFFCFCLFLGDVRPGGIDYACSLLFHGLRNDMRSYFRGAIFLHIINGDWAYGLKESCRNADEAGVLEPAWSSSAFCQCHDGGDVRALLLDNGP